MAATTQTPQEAYDLVVARVHAPVFFHKLAHDYKLRPRDAAEAASWLEMAGKLRQLYDVEQEKKAAAHTNLASRASAELDVLLQKAGLAQAEPAQPAAPTQAMKSAAANVAKDPAIAAAILTLFQAQNPAAQAA